MIGGRLVLSALLVAVASCAAPHSSRFDSVQREELGPLYSTVDLRSRFLEGVRLGMEMEVARAVLAANGYTRQIRQYREAPSEAGKSQDEEETFFRDGISRTVSLSYVRAGSGKLEVSGVSYHLNVRDDERTPEMWRQEIVQKFGQPSYWEKWLGANGAIGDRLAYVSSRSLREPNARAELDSCTADWQCGNDGVDCRKRLAASQEPVLQISFGYESVWYSLKDYRADYRSLMRSPMFRRQDRGYGVCPVYRRVD